ncbi:MAG: glycosyltransferase [Deltaproteobacteria bacterium]|nr:glycosyltransferase [Deltaproteobacteria bacterium]
MKNAHAPGAPVGIAQIVHSLEIGGMERVAMYLATRVDRARFRPMVVCLTVRGDFADEIESRGVEVVALGKRPGVDLRLPFRLARLLGERNVRIVHAHNSGPWFTGGLAKIVGGLDGAVVTDHSRPYPEKWTVRCVERTLAHAVHVVSVSEDNRQLLHRNIGIPLGKIRVIPNGVEAPSPPSPDRLAELRREFGIDGRDVIGVCVARLETQKAHEVLIDAVRRLADRGVPLRALCVGMGSREDELRSLAAQKGVADRVTFVGKRIDATDFLFLADLFVLSSDWEGLPMSVLEALGVGLPVVGTRVGDMELAVKDSVNGYLCAPRDAVALADALANLARDADRRRAMGGAGRELFAREFHVDRMIERYAAIYEECL